MAVIAESDSVLIAGLLNRNGLKTGHGNRWTRERVTSSRSHHRIPVFKAAADGVEPWLNLSDAAHVLKIASEARPVCASSRRRRRRDRRSPPVERRPLDLGARRTHDGHRQIDCRTRPPKHEAPRGTKPKRAKLIQLNDIDRWVF